MASKGKGNILYEILIVILSVALIATILYPSKTWKQESGNTTICQTRMSTIQQFELQYIGLTNTYSDSVDKVMETVLSDAGAVVALDSLVYWDGLVEKEELEAIINNTDLPQALRDLIKNKLVNNQPLGNLAVWDSVQFKVIDQLEAALANQDSVNSIAVDSCIVWNLIINDDVYAYSMDFEMPSSIKKSTERDMQKNVPVYQTAGWEYLKPAFYDSLKSLIVLAKQKDVWEKSENKKWEKEKRQQFGSELDLLSQEEKDSLWQENQRSFWEKVEPLVWQDQRKSLYKKEGGKWIAENEVTWQRMISQEWESNRKKQWQEDQLATLADSALTVFKAEKDSIWRSIVDDLRQEEYDKWVESSDKHIEEVIRNLWEQERRITWKEQAYSEWLKEKASDPDLLWSDLKEYLWSNANLDLWKVEEEKLISKVNSLKRLDYSILYNKLIGSQAIAQLVNGLSLPDSDGLIDQMKEMKEFDESKLAALGVIELFKDKLLKDIKLCPLSKQPLHVTVDNTTMPKWMSVECPVVVTDSASYAVVIEKSINDSLGVVLDTSKVDLKLSFQKKMFGGAKIKNHGQIDKEGRKSWEKKGR